MKHLLRISALLIALHLSNSAPSCLAAPPQMVSYQGWVAANGVPFDAPGQFKFALVGADGAASYWSHDGSSVAGGEPTTAISLAVVDGLYSIRLGDTNVAGMTIPLQSDVFAANSDVRLRVWFNDGTNGFQVLSPDQRLSSVAYALTADQLSGQISAANIGAGSITSSMLANNSVTASQLAASSVNSSNLADGAVSSAKLDPNLGQWKKSGASIFFDPAYVGIGPASSSPTAPLHVFSGGGWVNANFESEAGWGTWLTLANKSAGGTNWVISSTGSTPVGGVSAGSLMFGTGPSRANFNSPILTLDPAGRVGIDNKHPAAALDVVGNVGVHSGSLGIGTAQPQYPLHVIPFNPDLGGTMLTLGMDPAVANSSSLLMGVTAQAQGDAFIESVRGKSSTAAGLRLNRFGGNVGIGTGEVPPAAPLHISGRNSDGTVLALGGSPYAIGKTALTMGISSDQDGYSWIQSIATSGSTYGLLQVNPAGGPILLGDSAHMNYRSTVTVTRRQNSPIGASFLSADGQEKVRVDDPDYSLIVYGEAHKNNGNPFWNTTSDRRLKKDIHSLSSALNTLEQVRPVRFRYTEQHRAKNPSVPASEQFGVIAQEYAQIFPNFVSTNADGYLSVNTSPLVFFNTAAVQELHQQLKQRDSQIEQLKAQVTQLEQAQVRNAGLAQRVSKLEAVRSENQALTSRLDALQKQLERLSQGPVSVAAVSR